MTVFVRTVMARVSAPVPRAPAALRPERRERSFLTTPTGRRHTLWSARRNRSGGSSRGCLRRQIDRRRSAPEARVPVVRPRALVGLDRDPLQDMACIGVVDHVVARPAIAGAVGRWPRDPRPPGDRGWRPPARASGSRRRSKRGSGRPAGLRCCAAPPVAQRPGFRRPRARFSWPLARLCRDSAHSECSCRGWRAA
jgi:hypothetical protein